jgi:phosphate transport system protein
MEAIADLRACVVKMGALSEEILAKAARAVRETDADLAAEVVQDDVAIDQLDVEIDKGILQTLALQAPVAEDLRLVIAIKSMATDLERVGDLALNIARSAARLSERAPTDLPPKIEPLEASAADLLRRALDAFQSLDADAARSVMAGDDAVDALQDDLVRELLHQISEQPEIAPQAVDAILIAESLERIADHATNIAEDVILVAEAQNVKHGEKLPG